MKIATHNGKFHADDVFSVALLTELFPDAQVVRSRDPQVLDSADLVLDVGGVYDVAKQRFDHHQLSSGARDNGVLFSAFGLLWKEYGLRYCEGNRDVWRRIDSRLVVAIDAVDNGQDLYRLTGFGINPLDISETIGLFNPVDASEDFDAQFFVAVEFAKRIMGRLKAKYLAVIAAEKKFLSFYAANADKRYVVLPEYLPHGSIAVKQPELLFTIYPGATGNWTIQTVRKDDFSFDSRKYLPQAWRGLNNSDLAEATGVPDAVFCHKAGFIGAAESKEGVLRLLELALAAD